MCIVVGKGPMVSDSNRDIVSSYGLKVIPGWPARRVGMQCDSGHLSCLECFSVWGFVTAKGSSQDWGWERTWRMKSCRRERLSWVWPVSSPQSLRERATVSRGSALAEGILEPKGCCTKQGKSEETVYGMGEGLPATHLTEDQYLEYRKD